MAIDLSGRTAIVTGAGAGLGRAHALLLAEAGAAVLVNDMNGEAAEAVAAEIVAAGGKALAHACSVTDYPAVQAMVARAEAELGPVDILVANAGILRDKSFAKMELDDFRLVVEVHLMGSVHCAKAVWDGMRERGFGRIVFTTSSSGLYGNFGQSNYGAAKMALVGLMQTLSLEGAKSNVRVNCLAPTAATGMTEGLLPAPIFEKLGPEKVSPALLALVADEAPTRTILAAGAGAVEQAHVTLTRGIVAASDGIAAGADILARMAEIADRADETVPAQGSDQGQLELAKVMRAEGR
ncbi:SDR family NAD(P)-dependent oxidoreductase [Sphingomonas ginkgonis]|uniref:SDR family NAD(P)-dependent oxidoreductase n=1 Tax=Sphingomonas ginkgonis TaxID=2315330 RepID=A0A3S0EK58_9SPHN|nr:SDR family NAD(P)-dependent oxidoreductase [Sphingomonas ginkgonis]RST29525.1 SDR family NAD(P)-dependent oxidoreductase [Sphingomonas ginkgonis]